MSAVVKAMMTGPRSRHHTLVNGPRSLRRSYLHRVPDRPKSHRVAAGLLPADARHVSVLLRARRWLRGDPPARADAHAATPQPPVRSCAHRDGDFDALA